MNEDQQEQSSSQSVAENSTASVDSAYQARISILNSALANVKSEIQAACKNNLLQILLISLICAATVTVGYFIAKAVWEFNGYDSKWTWQMIYFSAGRVAIISGYFALASFFFGLLRSYLHIYQRNRHRRVVINSMASLIESGSNYVERQVVFGKVLEIIINFDDTGILKKKADFQMNNSILDSLKDLMKKASEEK